MSLEVSLGLIAAVLLLIGYAVFPVGGRRVTLRDLERRGDEIRREREGR